METAFLYDFEGLSLGRFERQKGDRFLTRTRFREAGRASCAVGACAMVVHAAGKSNPA